MISFRFRQSSLLWLQLFNRLTVILAVIELFTVYVNRSFCLGLDLASRCHLSSQLVNIASITSVGLVAILSPCCAVDLDPGSLWHHRSSSAMLFWSKIRPSPLASNCTTKSAELLMNATSRSVVFARTHFPSTRRCAIFASPFALDYLHFTFQPTVFASPFPPTVFASLFPPTVFASPFRRLSSLLTCTHNYSQPFVASKQVSQLCTS